MVGTLTAPRENYPTIHWNDAGWKTVYRLFDHPHDDQRHGKCDRDERLDKYVDDDP